MTGDGERILGLGVLSAGVVNGRGEGGTDSRDMVLDVLCSAEQHTS